MIQSPDCNPANLHPAKEWEHLCPEWRTETLHEAQAASHTAPSALVVSSISLTVCASSYPVKKWGRLRALTSWPGSTAHSSCDQKVHFRRKRTLVCWEHHYISISLYFRGIIEVSLTNWNWWTDVQGWSCSMSVTDHACSLHSAFCISSLQLLSNPQ